MNSPAQPVEVEMEAIAAAPMISLNQMEAAIRAEYARAIEDAARYVEGHGGVIPGSTVFVSLITGDRMPCMSGDARDKMSPHKRRYFDDATRDLASAIRSLKSTKGIDG